VIKYQHIKYAFCIIYNLIRLPIKSLIHYRKFKFGKIQLIRPGVSITIEGFEPRLTIKKANILSNTLIHVAGGKLEIGENVFINRNCNIIAQKNITIHDGCTIGPNVCIYDHDHIFGSENKKLGFKRADVIIGKNVWIGANAVILRGTRIGDGCVIGAGSIIKGDISPNNMVIQERNLRYFDI